MLAGKWAFDGRTTDEVRRKVITENAPSIASKRRAFVPPGLEKIVACAMAKKADQRYQSATEMRNDLIKVWREIAFEDLTKEALLARVDNEAFIAIPQNSLFNRAIDYIKKILPAASSFPAIPKQKFN